MSLESAGSPFVPLSLSQSLAVDPNALDSIRARRQKDPQGAAREVAQKFEEMFLNTLLRAMRKTQLNDAEQTQEMDMWRGMLDQQLSQTMSSAGGVGIAPILTKHILRLSNLEPPVVSGAIRHLPPLPNSPLATSWPVRAVQAYQAEQDARMVAQTKPDSSSPTQQTGHGPQQFVQQLLPHAKNAAAQLGIAPEFIIAHAALESGWGKKAIRHPDGRDSHNLFGIKAGSGWNGPTVDVLTTEYSNGVAQKRVESFRAYPSPAEAFADYAALLSDAPRYRHVRNQGQNIHGFAYGLQEAGYATDPRYAQKLVNVAASLNSA